MISKLITLANMLDKQLKIKIANDIDMLIKKYHPKNKQPQLSNDYFPIGQKGTEMGGNVDQENEVTEELNEEMEARDMEGFTEGMDNVIIDKNDNPGDKWGGK